MLSWKGVDELIKKARYHNILGVYMQMKTFIFKKA
jgi:hypothetical protein